ncbi:hypothetical protein [Vulcanisaeta distributa]|uniref:hypothetical protein n=1 Tax=Vulcanisaeta distributa TaxID=164451 RepID=UPI0006CF2A12|nr:hypothetical protein [Vulcanisaeta distributa]
MSIGECFIETVYHGYKVVCREGREWWELNGFELYHYIGGESLHCVLDLTGNWNAYRFRYDGGKFIGHLRIAYRRYVKLQRLAADVRAALEGIADSLEAREKAVRACIEACGPTPSRLRDRWQATNVYFSAFRVRRCQASGNEFKGGSLLLVGCAGFLVCSWISNAWKGQDCHAASR